MIFQIQQFSNNQKDELKALMTALYNEDPYGAPINEHKMNNTIQFLVSNPCYGQILVLVFENMIVGYAILIRYWSNEYGGLLLHLDELYVKGKHRGQKLGTQLIAYLIENFKKEFKGIVLEVHPSNKKAYSFYHKLVFLNNDNILMKYIWENA